jgi:hypothetical protein
VKRKESEKLFVQVPFPSRELGQNYGGSWINTHVNKRDARAYAKVATLNALSQSPFSFSKSDEFILICAIYPPNRRTDTTNNFCAMKNMIDGIAEGMNVNDRRFVACVVYLAGIDKNNPRVDVTIMIKKSGIKILIPDCT